MRPPLTPRPGSATLSASVPAPAWQARWTRLGTTMGYTNTPAKRAAIHAAVDAMVWVDPRPARRRARRRPGPVRGGRAVLRPGLAAARRRHHTPADQRRADRGRPGRDRRLIGLQSVTGDRYVLLDLGYEVIDLLHQTAIDSRGHQRAEAPHAMTTQPATPPDPPPSPDGDPPGAAVAGLAREVEALRRRLDQLQLAADAGRAARRPARPARRDRRRRTVGTRDAGTAVVAGPAHRPRPPSRVEHARRGPRRSCSPTLAGWVGGVYLRYPDAAQTLPECWLWHPEVVEELLWLHTAWLAAYRPGAAGTAVGDWHDRQRPGVVRRIRDYAGLCSLEQHQPGADRHTPAPTAPLADAVPAIAGWWATRRTDPAPAPTAEQLDAARRRGRRSEAADDHRISPTASVSRVGGRCGPPGWPSPPAPASPPRTACTRSPPPPGCPTPIGWLYPLITDGLALVAYAATARLHARRAPLRRRHRRPRGRAVRAGPGRLPRRRPRPHRAPRRSGCGSASAPGRPSPPPSPPTCCTSSAPTRRRRGTGPLAAYRVRIQTPCTVQPAVQPGAVQRRRPLGCTARTTASNRAPVQPRPYNPPSPKSG